MKNSVDLNQFCKNQHLKSITLHQTLQTDTS